MQLTAKYIQHTDGTYSAYIVEIDGVNTQGNSLEEAEENLQDALDMMISYRREKKKKAKNIIYRPLSFCGKSSTVPRHREINNFLCKKICKDLDIPQIF